MRRADGTIEELPRDRFIPSDERPSGGYNLVESIAARVGRFYPDYLAEQEDRPDVDLSACRVWLFKPGRRIGTGKLRRRIVVRALLASNHQPIVKK